MDRLAGRFRTLAADLYGYGQTPAWPEQRPLWLADEVALLEPVFATAGPRFHLVGHSYGGAVALMSTLTHPGRVESLVLFEPVLFSLLVAEDPTQAAALEIAAVRDETVAAVHAGTPGAAGARFVDYWMGPGTWAGMPEARREARHGVAGVDAGGDPAAHEGVTTCDLRRAGGGGAHGACHSSRARQRLDRGLPRYSGVCASLTHCQPARSFMKRRDQGRSPRTRRGR